MLIEQMPKAELHCHLDGLLCPEYVQAIQKKGLCPNLDLGKMRRLYPVTNPEEWFRLAEFLHPHEQGKGELYLEVLKLHLNALAAQNVQYVEIMLCSFLPTPNDVLDELMPKYRTVAQRIPGVEVGYTWAIAKTPNRKGFERKIEKILFLFRRGYIDGFTCAGDETLCRIKDYADVFQDLSTQGVPIEIHAGEGTGPEFIWDALEYGHPRRIGHAMSLFDDPDLPGYFQKNNIHIEFCPTSNLKVGGLQRIEDHPVFRAMDSDLSFSINTDDPGHFECSMNSEFELLNSVKPFDEAICERILGNSLGAAFGKYCHGALCKKDS